MKRDTVVIMLKINKTDTKIRSWCRFGIFTVNLKCFKPISNVPIVAFEHFFFFDSQQLVLQIS